MALIMVWKVLPSFDLHKASRFTNWSMMRPRYYGTAEIPLCDLVRFVWPWAKTPLSFMKDSLHHLNLLASTARGL
jgi:hypothetical protein